MPSNATDVLRSVVAEALECNPRIGEAVVALATNSTLEGRLASILCEATPHNRFQMLTTMLLGLCADAAVGRSGLAAQTVRSLLQGFYLAELVAVLGSLATEELVESEIHCVSTTGNSSAVAFWHWIREGIASCGPPSSEWLTPLRTRAEASQVLKLAANQYLAKVHLLLSLLSLAHDIPFEGLGEDPADEHQLLANAELGLPSVDELLFSSARGCDSGSGEAVVTPSPATTLAVSHAMAQWLGRVAWHQPQRGLQPSSPLLLVVVSDGAPSAISLEPEPPSHVWQLSAEGFERLMAANRSETVELCSSACGLGGGRLFCVAYRMTLPVITGRVYQKLYTQFVHARCTVCRTSPPIPTLCLLCGTFLCCNSECCRRRSDGDATGQTHGEVTHHAQTCGFGTCVFLQLSNSLVHIVADGFISCWGSLYLDGHGEEEYNLARPLHISEARLQQLTQSIREVSFDFESRLKWKKVIFV